ncbi:hypothetical protein Clacol_006556 [Clathrus columnatus]|uniref:Nudix hydrolase domain-containing protein n=1 Tax=Clathrus columnatus TaxID=1419009 RepID=A0AAV5AD58_9AGAM|nr:hypothetical protein Clacol_006556 [Clathrus columnatus]
MFNSGRRVILKGFRRDFSEAMSSTPKAIPIPRLSSSLILIDNQNRVLMVERNPKSKSFAGAYVRVFPGGVYDNRQDSSNELTAIRETFEETGILLATPNLPFNHFPPVKQLEAARRDIHAQRISFTQYLKDNNLSPNVGALLPFTQWITPSTAPRRFHAYFFVAFLSTSEALSDESSMDTLQQLPTPDGGIEVISVRFIKPQDAISEFMADKIFLMPPQFYLLNTLASLLQNDSNSREQRETIQRLGHGSFGKRIFNPQPLPQKDSHGRITLTYEGDETRGGPVGARHRSIVKQGKGDNAEISSLKFEGYTDTKIFDWDLFGKELVGHQQRGYRGCRLSVNLPGASKRDRNRSTQITALFQV